MRARMSRLIRRLELLDESMQEWMQESVDKLMDQ